MILESIAMSKKFIVFLLQILLHFNSCQECKSVKPAIETCCSGTWWRWQPNVSILICAKPENTWNSQPQMTGTKMAAGNFHLCFSTLISGASPSEVLLVFRNMRVACFTLDTYEKYQSVSASNHFELVTKPRLPFVQMFILHWRLSFICCFPRKIIS